MSVFQFRFHSLHGMRNASAPRRRHPLVRVALGLLGVGVLLVLVFFSVFVGLGMLAIGLGYRLWKQRGKPIAREPRTLDGEFRMVRKTALPSS